MKSRPGQGLTEISKKIRLKQNDHASRRTQRSPHTRRRPKPPEPPPRERYSSLPFRRPAIRYSVGEIESLFRKILARPSPLPAPQRRAILSTGRSVAASNMPLASSRARNKYSDGV